MSCVGAVNNVHSSPHIHYNLPHVGFLFHNTVFVADTRYANTSLVRMSPVKGGSMVVNVIAYRCNHDFCLPEPSYCVVVYRSFGVFTVYMSIHQGQQPYRSSMRRFRSSRGRRRLASLRERLQMHVISQTLP